MKAFLIGGAIFILGAIGVYLYVRAPKTDSPDANQSSRSMNEQVSFATRDGVTIKGDYYEGGGERAVLLLHMMPATRSSWVAFANTLVLEGWSALAIDLRGHGESTMSPRGVLDYQKFTDAEHQASIADVEAAVAYLTTEKKMKEISIAGASIGANLAFFYAASHPEIRSLVLLSPGLDYHGVNAEAVAGQFGGKTRLFFLASRDDEYAAASTEEIYQKVKGEKQIQLFGDAGHGTTILERQPEYLKILASWLAAK
ncbi:MAG: alpha/beta fold hydrolase [Candidatus Sungbacteria bacterium]|uniref:Alpha/beta fold hydrolase n=1 Tax=Candidatus Sungiibacteriota bacterium TaxID=2750080 RepID=A0A931SDZ7_9BACT|nr:alpha/beta fold hydrolase [Candidatus Sungbacteria bacterium]